MLSLIGSLLILTSTAGSIVMVLLLLASAGPRESHGLLRSFLSWLFLRTRGKPLRMLDRLALRAGEIGSALIFRGAGVRTKEEIHRIIRLFALFLPFVPLIALGIALYQFYENDLSLRTVVSSSSFDFAPALRITAAAWTSPPVILLLLHVLLLVTGTGFLPDRFKKENHLLLLPVAVFGLLTGGLLSFSPDLQPFREFAVPMKVAMGLDLSMLHWTRVFMVPVHLLAVATLFPVYLQSARSLIRGGFFSGFDRSVRYWLHTAWYLGVLATGLRLVWNYQVGSGHFWNWSPVETGILSFVFFTGSLELSTLSEGKDLKRGRILAFLTFHGGLLSIWPLMDSAHPGSGLFLAIATLVHFMIASRNLFFGLSLFQGRRLLPDNLLSREGAYRLASFFLLPAGAFTLIGSVVSLLPLSCVLSGDLPSCEPDPIHGATYNLFLYPLWALSFLFFALLPLLRSNRETGSRSMAFPLLPLAIAGLAGVAAPLFYREVYFPHGESKIWTLTVFIPVFFLFTLSVAGSVQEFLQAGREESEKKQAGFLRLALTLILGGVAFSSFSPDDRFEFHYYMMRQFPDTDQVHYYSGDKIYPGHVEIQATDLFLNGIFPEAAYSSSRIKLSVSREAHFVVVPRGASRVGMQRQEGYSPHMLANLPFIGEDAFLRRITGYAPDGQVRTEIRSRPDVNPATAELIRDGAYGEARRTSQEIGDILSTPLRDIQIRLEKVEAVVPQTFDLDHLYEFFYFDEKKSQEAYYGYFPATLTATVSIRPVPLAKIIWAGLLLILFLYINFAWTGVQTLHREPSEEEGKNNEQE